MSKYQIGMHRSGYSSDETGEISWPSDEESKCLLDPALSTPLKIPQMRKRNRKSLKSRRNLNSIITKINTSSSGPAKPLSPLRKQKNSQILFSQSRNCTPIQRLNITDCVTVQKSQQYTFLKELPVSPVLVTTKNRTPLRVLKLDIPTLTQEKSTSGGTLDENISFKECNKLTHNCEKKYKDLYVNSTPPSRVLSLKRNISVSPTDHKIFKKTRSYFSNDYSSQTTSEVSIEFNQNSSEILDTQVDIIESRSPSLSQNSEVKVAVEVSSSSKNSSENTPDSLAVRCEDSESKYTRRYKKGGLADRMQTLIKKHRNLIVLWRHERYLASNSKFMPPNTEKLKYLSITKINNEYNIYLIEALDLSNDSKCMILINVNHEGSETLTENNFLKLYEPYEVLQTNFGSVFLNLCKFECIDKKLA